MHYIKGTGYVEVSGAKVCSKREMALRLAKVYGAQGDRESYTRLVIESRVNQAKLDEAFRLGSAMKGGN